MDCLDAKPKLEPCARGELGAAEQVELDRHVATCEGCRLELELTRAVLGSSGGGADEPPFAAPLPADDQPPSLSFDAVPLEPGIEQERLPEPPSDSPAPPRVLTSQLPEETDEPLDLESLHAANAYDPGAIDLPPLESADRATGISSDASIAFEQGVPPAPPAASFSDENLSFADLSAGGPVVGSGAKAASAGKPEPGKGASWAFEPVDVPRASAPPEESLSFAKEALDRKRGNALRKKQGARLLLWIGGAIGGVGLLGASVWMALAFRDVPAGHDPGTIPAVEPPPGTQPGVPADSTVDPEISPGITAADSMTPLEAGPSVLKAGATGSAMLPGITSPGTAAPKSAAGTSQDPARVGGTQPGQARAPETSSPAKAVTTAPQPSFREDELAPAPRREPKILTVEPDAAPGSDPVDEPTADPADRKEPTRSVSTAPIFIPPSSETGSSTGTAGKQPDATASSGPIERLHLATITAEQNKDLEALRKLKEPWKSMIRSTTGAERSRSKREYADCLWAIQEITNRSPDRKEALTAYREYVLHAPAGGADARTVGRMRHLEDILSDPQ